MILIWLQGKRKKQVSFFCSQELLSGIDVNLWYSVSIFSYWMNFGNFYSVVFISCSWLIEKGNFFFLAVYLLLSLSNMSQWIYDDKLYSLETVWSCGVARKPSWSSRHIEATLGEWFHFLPQKWSDSLQGHKQDQSRSSSQGITFSSPIKSFCSYYIWNSYFCTEERIFKAQ